MADSNTALQIVESLGGPENIESLSHCATRLRFQLRDSSVVQQSQVEQVPGVMGAVPQAGNRYQVVIGGGVEAVYDEIQALPEMNHGTASNDDVKAAARAQGPRGRFAWLDTFFEFLSDSFRPILGALLGASLFITFMALMGTLHVIPNWADPTVTLPPTWAFINLAWRCVFYFLPLMVAYNATKKIGADPWIGFAVMAVVMLPDFSHLSQYATQATVAGSTVNIVWLFGGHLPLTIFDYGSQVFPPLLMAAVLGPLYKGLKKIIPANVQLIFVPFLSMLVMIPLTAFLIGPLGVYAGAGLANVLRTINDVSPFIFAIVIPLAYPFMVPLGLHWPINAIMLLNIQTLGYDFIQGPMGAWNFACFGATAGVLVLSWREKDMEMRQTATGALAAGLLGGISEPSLYGIHLRFRNIYPLMLIGCLAGGLVQGIGGGVTTKAFVFTSLLTVPAFSNIPLYGLSVGVAFATSMALIMIRGYRPNEKGILEQESTSSPELAMANAVPEMAMANAALASDAVAGAAPTNGSAATAVPEGLVPEVPAGSQLVVGSPVAGTVMPLADVPDPVFAGGIVGPGVGIEPTGDTVCAPGDGKIVVAQATGHAFGITLDNGVELLIHVGIDTVNLNGKGFDVKVHAGEWVSAGQPLVTFDRAVIEEAGYSLVTPVVVTNHANYQSVEQSATGTVKIGDPIITVTTK